MTFARLTTAIDWLGTVKRVRFPEPSWTSVGPEELAALVVPPDLDDAG